MELRLQWEISRIYEDLQLWQMPSGPLACAKHEWNRAWRLGNVQRLLVLLALTWRMRHARGSGLRLWRATARYMSKLGVYVERFHERRMRTLRLGAMRAWRAYAFSDFRRAQRFAQLRAMLTQRWVWNAWRQWRHAAGLLSAFRWMSDRAGARLARRRVASRWSVWRASTTLRARTRAREELAMASPPMRSPSLTPYGKTPRVFLPLPEAVPCRRAFKCWSRRTDARAVAAAAAACAVAAFATGQRHRQRLLRSSLSDWLGDKAVATHVAAQEASGTQTEAAEEASTPQKAAAEREATELAAKERQRMWEELHHLRAQLDAAQYERRTSSFIERVHVAQLRQQTEMLRRSLLAPRGPVAAPAHELERQNELLREIAELKERLQDESARHAGFEKELRSFASHMKLDVRAAGARSAAESVIRL